MDFWDQVTSLVPKVHHWPFEPAPNGRQPFRSRPRWPSAIWVKCNVFLGLRGTKDKGRTRNGFYLSLTKTAVNNNHWSFVCLVVLSDACTVTRHIVCSHVVSDGIMADNFLSLFSPVSKRSRNAVRKGHIQYSLQLLNHGYVNIR